MNSNELSRRRKQKQRLEAKTQETILFQAAHLRVKSTVAKIREILADSVFRTKLAEEGVKTIPVILAVKVNAPASSTTSAEGLLNEATLEFAAAWAFFYPLLNNQKIVDYLQVAWPEFVVELRDAFILLVMNGPFPQECCAVGRPVRKPFPLDRAHFLKAGPTKRSIDK